MGSLVTDDNHVDVVDTQTAAIHIRANNNSVISKSMRFYGSLTRSSVENSTISAAAIKAGTLILGTVNSNVNFHVETSNNEIICERYSYNNALLDGDLYFTGAEISSCGIYADNATLSHFDGNITVEALNNVLLFGNATSRPTATGIHVAEKLISTTNLSGTITVETDLFSAAGVGVRAGNIRVTGLIDTDVDATHIGIIAGSLTADGFTGSISSYLMGISVAAISSGFNVAGTISSMYGIGSNGELNIRISGQISSSDYAVLAEHTINADGTTMVSTRKTNDTVTVARGARVIGNIDLGAGMYNLSINSGASVKGVVRSGAGEINVIFDLEGDAGTGPTLYMGSLDADDKTIKDTSTITVNLNYAKAGETYQLIQYGFDAREYWVDVKRQIAFRWQGKFYNTFMENGSATISVEEAVVNVRFDTASNTFSVNVDGTLPAARELPLAGLTVGDYFAPERAISTGTTTLTLDWSALSDYLNAAAAAGTRLADDGTAFAEVTGIQAVYDLYDASGNILLSGCTTASTATGGCEINLKALAQINDLEVDDMAKIVWTGMTVSGKDADGGDITATLTPGTAVDRFVEDFDAEHDTLTLSWFGLDAEEYGLPEIAVCEIEYTIYDETGAALGASILARVAGDRNSCVIHGVEAGFNVRWRARLLGDNSGNRVGAWSDMYSLTDRVDTAVNTPSSFETDAVTTRVLDANERPNANGVVAAVAELFWNGLTSEKTVRNYEIQYFDMPTQLTIDDIPEGQTLNEYIASDLFDNYVTDNNIAVYTKLLTGNTAILSNLQNQTYCYWRFRAIDVAGVKSDWVAGDTFRVWANNDTSAPVFENKATGVIDFNFPAADVIGPDSENPKETGYSAMLGWQKATDDESGVSSYVVEISADGGQTFSEYAKIEAESMIP